MTIPCQVSKEEGVTTIGSSPSTMTIDTSLEAHTDYLITSQYAGTKFEIVEDIV